MSGNVNEPIPDYVHEDLRYLLRLLKVVLSKENGWRDNLKALVAPQHWSIWSLYDGAVCYYKGTKSSLNELADTRQLPEFVFSWTTSLSDEAIKSIGETVAANIAPGDGPSETYGRRWLEEVSRTAFRLHFLLSSDWFD